MIYFDNSATTQVLSEAAQAALHAMTCDYYNPSSAYSKAVQVERQVNEARGVLASKIGALPKEIIFTSGATESNNMAVFGTLKARRGKVRLITTEVEHPSIYEVFKSLQSSSDIEPVFLNVDGTGRVDMNMLSDCLTENTALVSVMHVNNELGTINDLDGIYRLVKSKCPNAVVHSDGVQAYLKLPAKKLSVDMYSVSGHKFHAPKGVGFLYVSSAVKFKGGQIGGGQEQNLRSGTTNVSGILAMSVAADLYGRNQGEWLYNMRLCKERLASNLSQAGDVLVNGPAVEEGAPHILNLSFMGIRGEVLLHALEEQGILVATGSACSSHKKGKNRVLAAIGVNGARQEGALRFSFCPFNTLREVDAASQAILEQVKILRKYRRR